MKHAPLFLGLSLGLVGCDRSNTTSTTSTTGTPGAEAGAMAASAQPAPSNLASAKPVASAVPPVPPSSSLPAVEKIAATKCPARIAVVKLDKQRVELNGCPENTKMQGKGKSFLTLVDEKGAKLNELEITDGEEHSEALELRDLHGSGRPVFFVTTTQPGMGSWAGPRTTLYDIESDRLVPLQVTNKDGKREPIELISAIRSTWWTSPARSGKGQDIYVIKTSAEEKSTGYRFFFENGKWTARFNQLKKWTGEKLKDTEAEFP